MKGTELFVVMILVAIAILGLFLLLLAAWDRTTARHRKILAVICIGMALCGLLVRGKTGAELFGAASALFLFFWDLSWWDSLDRRISRNSTRRRC